MNKQYVFSEEEYEGILRMQKDAREYHRLVEKQAIDAQILQEFCIQESQKAIDNDTFYGCILISGELHRHCEACPMRPVCPSKEKRYANGAFIYGGQEQPSCQACVFFDPEKKTCEKLSLLESSVVMREEGMHPLAIGSDPEGWSCSHWRSRILVEEEGMEREPLFLPPGSDHPPLEIEPMYLDPESNPSPYWKG